MMTNTIVLREKIRQSGLKYNYIAPCLKLTTTGLQRKIENDNEFKASEIKRLSDLLSLSPEERDAIFFA